MITACAAQMDGHAILVVNAADGPSHKPAKTSLLGRQVGIPTMVVYMNKVTRLTTKSCCELVGNGNPRNCCSFYGLPRRRQACDSWFALHAMNGNFKPENVRIHRKLMAAVTKYPDTSTRC